jgi:hypothetical protein
MTVASVELACRAVLLLVFGIALVSKVRSRKDFDEFADSLTALGVRRTAILVVAAEAAAVVLLALPTEWGFVLAIGLLAVFIAGIVRAVRGKQKVSCRCFGASGNQLTGSHVIRNSLLVVVAAIGWFADATSTWSPATGPTTIALLAGAFVGLAFVRWDDLRFLLT